MSTTKSTTNHNATTMADLLKAHTEKFTPIHRGDKVTGVITKLTNQEILMDINFKTEALVIEKDRKLFKNLLSVVKVGDTVTANVISPESEKGNPILTLRQFVEEHTWGRLTKEQKAQERIEVTIKESTRGGFIVETAEGVVGFLPNSHVGTNPSTMALGSKIKVGILELTRETKKVIFSQKSVVSVEEFHKAVKEFKAGDKVTVSVSTITPFGLFVGIPQKEDPKKSLDGLIHISEISWERTPSELSSLFTVGQEVEAIIVSFDDNAKRVDLSVKRLLADPFEKAVASYVVDQKVTGKVKTVADQGVTIELPAVDGVALEGMIKKDKIPPTVSFEVGQNATVTISQIDMKRRKISLSPVLLEKPLTYR